MPIELAYRPLYGLLARQPAATGQLVLSCAEIEAVIHPHCLPVPAYWWDGHPAAQSDAWHEAGFRVARLDYPERLVYFHRLEPR